MKADRLNRRVISLKKQDLAPNPKPYDSRSDPGEFLVADQKSSSEHDAGNGRRKCQKARSDPEDAQNLMNQDPTPEMDLA